MQFESIDFPKITRTLRRFFSEDGNENLYQSKANFLDYFPKRKIKNSLVSIVKLSHDHHHSER